MACSGHALELGAASDTLIGLCGHMCAGTQRGQVLRCKCSGELAGRQGEARQGGEGCAPQPGGAQPETAGKPLHGTCMHHTLHQCGICGKLVSASLWTSQSLSLTLARIHTLTLTLLTVTVIVPLTVLKLMLLRLAFYIALMYASTSVISHFGCRCCLFRR